MRCDGTICIPDSHAQVLDWFEDKFLTKWRVRAEEQAELGLNPLHLLSGASTDYYAVILVSAGLASIPVFMSITTAGVCHIVHAIPGNLDANTGMPLYDAYLPMEHLCFRRHVRMLRPAASADFDYRDQLPLPHDWRLAFQQMALTCLTCDLRRALSRKPTPRVIFTERSPFGSYHVFAKGNLDGADLKMCKFTLDQLMTTLPENLLVTFLYLRAHVGTVERRIRGRGRDAETGVTFDLP